MNGLVRKVLAPLFFIGALSLPFINAASAKEGEEVKKVYFSIGAGAYQGNEQSMKDMYGTIPRIRTVFEAEAVKNFTYGGAISYSKKKGNPEIYQSGDGFENVTGDLEVQMLQIEGLLKYYFGNERVKFYAGGGIAVINFREKMTLSGYLDRDYFSQSGETKKDAVGPVVLFGLNIPVNKEGTFIYGEISGSSAEIKGDLGEVDIGGTCFEAGVRFTF